MEKLLASQQTKITKLFRGQQIEGKIIATSDRELILDLGAKSEGILSTRDIPDSLKNLKTGDQIKVYVALPENENGQVVLSFTHKREEKDQRPSRWSKFTAAQSSKTKLQGVIKETNKGGLIVEVDGSRGFIPHSQLGLEFLGRNPDELIGQRISFSVIEVDEQGNKLVFSQKEAQSEDFDKKSEKYKPDEIVKGTVVNVSEAGVTVKLEDGLEGFLKASKTDTKYEADKSSSFLVDSVDTTRKRINLAPFVTSTAGLIYK